MTTQELYQELLSKDDLHSVPELYDDILVWHLFKDAYIQAYCRHGDTCLDIVSESIYTGILMHSHPAEDQMLMDLYAFGKQGNMVVLEKSVLATNISYVGPSNQCPFDGRIPFRLGRWFYPSKHFIYLEQK